MDDGDRSVVAMNGAYLPCLDQGEDYYREHLVEFEHMICESQMQGPLLLGDFNAHASGWRQVHWGTEVLLQEVLEQCDFSAVSQGL